MKPLRILLLMILLAHALPGSAQTDTVYYYGGQGKVKSITRQPRFLRKGIELNWYENGQLQSQVALGNSDHSKKNNYEGKYQSFDQDGKPAVLAYYHKGKLEGVYKSWSYGKLVSISEYLHGNLINNDTHYYQGQLSSVTPYKIVHINGNDTSLIDGMMRGYEYGKLTFEAEYHNGILKGRLISYRPNGKPSHESIYNTSAHYVNIRGYHENGGLSWEALPFHTRVNGRDTDIYYTSKYYDEAGRLRKYIATYQGIPNGYAWETNEEGKIVSESINFATPEGNTKNNSDVVASLQISYYPGGTLRSETFHDSRSHTFGTNAEWYIDGHLKKLHYENGDIRWLQNGDLLHYYFYRENPYDPLDTFIGREIIDSLYKQYSNTTSRQIRFDSTANFKKVSSYYDQEHLHFETYLIHGKADSLFRGFYPDGRLMVEIHLKAGVPEGMFSIFNQNGRIYEQRKFIAGRMWRRLLADKRGTVRSEYGIDSIDKSGNVYAWRTDINEYDKNRRELHRLLNGKEEGMQEAWDGYVRTGIYFLKDAHLIGLSTHYHLNGKKSQEDFYDSLGQKNGAHYQWHPNGQLSEKGFYRNDKNDSVWQSYNVNGVVTATVRYKDGVRIKEQAIIPSVPCLCIESDDDEDSYMPSILEFVDSNKFTRWEFPFHKSLRRSINNFFIDQLIAEPDGHGTSASFTLVTYKKIELEFPGHEGMSLLLSPCFNTGKQNHLEMAANITKGKPSETRLVISDQHLAFRFNPALLRRIDNDSAALAFFKTGYLMYDKEGIHLDHPDSFCFTRSLIGKSGCGLQLGAFTPDIVIGNSGDYNMDEPVTDSDPADDVIRGANPFIGIYKGKGMLSLPYEQDELLAQIINVVITHNQVAGNILLNRSHDNSSILHFFNSRDERMNIREAAFIALLKQKGFDVGEKVLAGKLLISYKLK